MAFAFSKINAALGDEPQKQDIFGGQQTQAGTVDGAQGPGGAQPSVKSSTAGDLDAGAGGSAPPGQTSAPSLEQGQSAGRAALRANLGKTAAPTVLDDVGQRISARQNALQGEADSYVGGQKAKQASAYGSVDKGDYEAAVSGNDYSYGKVNNLLKKKSIDPIEGFAPTTDVEVDDTERLKSDRGLQELIARGQGPSYNEGESAFDLRALRKTAGFDQRLRDIQAQQEAARQLKRDIAGTSQKSVEDYGAGQLTAAQKAATDWLTEQGSSIDQANAKEAADYKAKIDAVRNGGGWGGSTEDIRAVLDKIRSSDPTLSPYLGQASGVNVDPRSVTGIAGGGLVDPNKYVSYADTPGADAFVDDGEARRFNAIMGLLGKGDARVAGQRPTGPDRTFDSAGYEQALRDAAAGLRPPPPGAPGAATGTGTGTAAGPGTPTGTDTPSGDPGAYVPPGDTAPEDDVAPDEPGNDQKTAHWNVPGGGTLPIGITEGQKKQAGSFGAPLAEGARQAGVHPTQLGTKLVEGVGNVGKGIEAVGGGLAKAGGVGSDAAKSGVTNVAKSVAKLDSKTAVGKVQADPAGALKDLLSKGKDSQFYAPGRDPRNAPGFWDAVKAGGYDTNAVDKLITGALGGKGPTNIDGALAQAKKAAPKAAPPKVTAPKVTAPQLQPPPAFSGLPDPNAYGSGELFKGGIPTPSLPGFSQIGDVLNKAGGDAAQYAKEKGGSAAKTAKKILGRG